MSIVKVVHKPFSVDGAMSRPLTILLIDISSVQAIYH